MNIKNFGLMAGIGLLALQPTYADSVKYFNARDELNCSVRAITNNGHRDEEREKDQYYAYLVHENVTFGFIDSYYLIGGNGNKKESKAICGAVEKLIEEARQWDIRLILTRKSRLEADLALEDSLSRRVQINSYLIGALVNKLADMTLAQRELAKQIDEMEVKHGEMKGDFLFRMNRLNARLEELKSSDSVQAEEINNLLSEQNSLKLEFQREKLKMAVDSLTVQTEEAFASVNQALLKDNELKRRMEIELSDIKELRSIVPRVVSFDELTGAYAKYDDIRANLEGISKELESATGSLSYRLRNFFL